MRIVYIGSKNLGCLCLRELIRRGEDIAAVIARKDDPYPGMWYESLSKIAKENGLKLFKPENVNHPDFADEIKRLKPDVFFVVFYPAILKKHFIDIPPLGCINLHFAPLPKYRGCLPGAWAVIEGQREFGVTMHYIDEGVDSGDIIAQKMFEIKDDDTGLSLYKRCEEVGFWLFKETFPIIKEGRMSRTPQDKAKVIYHKRGLPNNLYIDWGRPARDIYDFIRALTFPPFPSPKTLLNGNEVFVKSSRVLAKNAKAAPGQVVDVLSNNEYIVATLDSNLFIETDGKIGLKKGDKLETKTRFIPQRYEDKK